MISIQDIVNICFQMLQSFPLLGAFWIIGIGLFIGTRIIMALSDETSVRPDSHYISAMEHDEHQSMTPEEDGEREPLMVTHGTTCRKCGGSNLLAYGPCVYCGQPLNVN